MAACSAFEMRAGRLGMAYSQEQGQLLYRVFFNPHSPVARVIEAAGARPVVNHQLMHGLDVAFIRDDPVVATPSNWLG